MTGNQNPLAVNNIFLQTFDDLGLEQVVDFPTRFDPDNTLDLLLTNRPSLIQRCETIPGVADHAAVLAITRIQTGPRKPIRRKIHLWKRADIEAIRKRVRDYDNTFHA